MLRRKVRTYWATNTCSNGLPSNFSRPEASTSSAACHREARQCHGAVLTARCAKAPMDWAAKHVQLTHQQRLLVLVASAHFAVLLLLQALQELVVADGAPHTTTLQLHLTTQHRTRHDGHNFQLCMLVATAQTFAPSWDCSLRLVPQAVSSSTPRRCSPRMPRLGSPGGTKMPRHLSEQQATHHQGDDELVTMA